MTDVTVAQPGTVALEPPSTILNPETVSATSGGGKPSLGADQGTSLEDTLTAELSRLRAEDEAATEPEAEAEAKDVKPEPKEKKADEKAEAKPDRSRTDKGQFAAKAEPEKDAAPEADADAPEKAQAGQDAERPSEGRGVSEPPARFLPKEREQWQNAPKVVRAGVERMVKEFEAEREQYRASHDRYQQIRDFDDLARSNGRDLRDSLAKMHRIDEMIGRDPIGALDEVLREIGPRRADGSPLTIYDVANYVVQNGPEAYQQRAQATREASAAHEITALRQEIETMRAYQVASSVETSVIAPFAAQHPRFHELQDDIALFLQSGKVPANLSPQDRLAAAYDMAERINPRAPVEAGREALGAPDPRTDRRVDPAGQKSIRGAPDNGFDPVVEGDDFDLSTLLRREYRRIAS